MLKEENKLTVSVTVKTAQPTILYSRQHKQHPPTYPINLATDGYTPNTPPPTPAALFPTYQGTSFPGSNYLPEVESLEGPGPLTTLIEDDIET